MGGWSHWETNKMHPRITAKTPCLSCGRPYGKHKMRHPFRPKFPGMTNDGAMIDEDTCTIAYGALELDVEMARSFGWSEARIVRTANALHELAQDRPRVRKRQRRA